MPFHVSASALVFSAPTGAATAATEAARATATAAATRAAAGALAGSATVGTTLGFISEAFGRVELLLASGKGETRLAVNASKGTIRKGQLDSLLRLT